MNRHNWIPVSERLPFAPKGYWSNEVLVADDSGSVSTDSYYYGIEGFWDSHRNKPRLGSVTHWMSIPVHPEAKIVYRDGEPCTHKGSSHHAKHPCEVCGRFMARGEVSAYKAEPWIISDV